MCTNSPSGHHLLLTSQWAEQRFALVADLKERRGGFRRVRRGRRQGSGNLRRGRSVGREVPQWHRFEWDNAYKWDHYRHGGRPLGCHTPLLWDQGVCEPGIETLCIAGHLLWVIPGVVWVCVRAVFLLWQRLFPLKDDCRASVDAACELRRSSPSSNALTHDKRRPVWNYEWHHDAWRYPGGKVFEGEEDEERHRHGIVYKTSKRARLCKCEKMSFWRRSRETSTHTHTFLWSITS